MESSFKKRSLSKRLSGRLSSGKSLHSLKAKFKSFLSDHNRVGDTSSKSSESDLDKMKFSTPPGRRAKISKTSTSSSSSDSEDGSPSKPKRRKSDSSSASSSEKTEEKRKSDSSSVFSSEKDRASSAKKMTKSNSGSDPSSPKEKKRSPSLKKRKKKKKKSDSSSDSSSDASSEKKKEKPPPWESKSTKKKKKKKKPDSSSDASSEKKKEKTPSWKSKSTKKKKSDSSSSSSSEKIKEAPSKPSRETLQLLLRDGHGQPHKLPPLEEALSLQRHSSATQSDMPRSKLLNYSSLPTSPADLSHNFNISYRGGDSSPVALVHSLSHGVSGRYVNQPSEISFASPPSSSYLGHDVVGRNLDEKPTSPFRKIAQKLKRLGSAYYDEEQGACRCRRCGWTYPVQNPSGRHRREHKQHCGELKNVQQWLGLDELDGDDVQGATDQGIEESCGDLELLDGSTLQETLDTAHKHSMATLSTIDDEEGVSDVSNDHHAVVDHGGSDETLSSASGDHHGVKDQSNVDHGENEGQSKLEGVSEESNNHHEVHNQGKLESLSNWSTPHHDREDQTNLESVSSGSPDSHGVEDQSNADHGENEGQRKLDGVPEDSNNHHEVQNQSKLESLSNWSTHHHDREDQTNLEGVSSRSPDFHDVDDQSNADQGENEGPSKLEGVSEESNNHPEVQNQSKLESLSNWSTHHHDTEDQTNLEGVSSSSPDFDGVDDQSNADPGENEGQSKLDGASEEANNHHKVQNPSKLKSLSNWYQSKLGSLTNWSTPHHDTEDQTSLEGVSSGSPDFDGVEDQSNADHGENEGQSKLEGVSEESNNRHKVQSQSKLESLSNWSTDHHDVEDQTSLENVSSGSPDFHGLEDQSNADHGEIECQSNSERMSEESVNHFEVQDNSKKEDQSNLGSVSSGSHDHHGEQQHSKLDDIVETSLFVKDPTKVVLETTPDTEREQNMFVKPEEDNSQKVTCDSGAPQVLGEAVEGQETQTNEKPQEVTGEEVKLQGNRKQVGSGEYSIAVADDWSAMTNHEEEEANDHTPQQIDNVESLKEVGIQGMGSYTEEVPSLVHEDEVGSQMPGADELGEKAEAIKEVENLEPKDTADGSLLNNNEEATQADEVREQIHITAGGQDERDQMNNTEPDHKDIETEEHDSTEIGEDGKDVDGPDHSKQYDMGSRLEGRDDGVLEITSPEHVQHEASSSSSTHVVEYDFEQVVRKQETHDLICPVCGSCVTKRVILRKRKRTLVAEGDASSMKLRESKSGARGPYQEPPTDDGETWGCLACLSLFIRRVGGGRQKFEAEGVSSEGVDEKRESVPCLSLIFPSFRWGPGRLEPDLVEPLLPQNAGDVHVADSAESTRGLSNAAEDGQDKSSFNCLPELRPDFSWGTSFPRHELPPSVAQEINRKRRQPSAMKTTYVVEDLASLKGKGILDDSDSAAVSLQQESHAVDNAEEKSTINCLPDLRPDFSWGTSFPRHELPPSVAEEINRKRGQSSATTTAYLVTGTQELHAVEGAQEKSSFNCLPDLRPDFSWGTSFPRHDLPASVAEEINRKRQSSATKTPIVVLETQEPHAVDGAQDKGSFNCLPDLRPDFSWGTSFPRHELPPSVAEEIKRKRRQSSTTTSADVGQNVSDDGGITVVPVTQEPHAVEGDQEKSSFNCLPDLQPDFSWGTSFPTLELPPSVAEEINRKRRQPSTMKTTYVVEDLANLKGKGILDDSGSAAVSLQQESHAVDNAEEKSTISCLPDLRPDFSWGTSFPRHELPPSVAEEINRKRGQSSAKTTAYLVTGTQEPHAVEGAQEKSSFNCLPDLRPDFSWGTSFPRHELPASVAEEINRKRQSSATKSPIVVLETQEPHAVDGAQDKGSFNCLPDLRPDFSWGTSFPRHELPPSVAEEINRKRRQSPTTKPGYVVVQQEEGDNIVSTEQTSQESATCNCLQGFLPAMSWRLIGTADEERGLHTPLLAPKISDEEDSQGPGPISPPVSPVAELATSSDDSSRHTIVSQDIHIEGSMTVETGIATMVKPSPGAAEVVDSVQTHNDRYLFETDVHDGKVSHTIEREPKPLESAFSTGFAKLSMESDGRPSSEIDDDPKLVHAPELSEINETPEDEPSLEESVSQNDFEGVDDDPKLVHAPELSEINETPEDEPSLEESVSQKDFGGVSYTWFPWLTGRWPWPSMEKTAEAGVHEPLLHPAEEIEHIDRCRCLPTLPAFSFTDLFRDDLIAPATDGQTVVGIHTDDTDVKVSGDTIEETADHAIDIAENQHGEIQTTEGREYLKSIVHGGLDVTLVSLGVVSSGAGSSAKTITVLAIGLSSLFFGIITYFNTIMSLYSNHLAQFHKEVGKSLLLNGFLALVSFVFFGALAPITYAFSFRHTSNRDYKFASTCGVALVSIVLLGAANAHVKLKSPYKVISKLVTTGLVAAIVGYQAGNYLSQLFEWVGFDSV